MTDPVTDHTAEALPPGVPPEAAEFLREMGYFDDERLRPGDRVAAIEMARLDDSGTVTIGGPAARPVVLIFGSYT